MGKLAVGSVLYAGMPTVMNRVFRHDRAEKAGLLPTEKPVTVSSPTPLVPVAKPLPSILTPLPRTLISLGR